MTEGDDRKVTIRMNGEKVDWIDRLADQAGVDRSTMIRRFVDFGIEAQGSAATDADDRRGEHDEIVERNQELRQILPSKWRSHVRSLFLDDLRDDCSPEDLETIAQGYRQQAVKKEEIADSMPLAPEGDLVGIVDEELANALEAADLSNWYEDVENPYERHLSGVEEGRREREAAVSVVQGVVWSFESLRKSFTDPTLCPDPSVEDVPIDAEEILPEDVTREDVAEIAAELHREQIPAEKVPEAIPTVDPDLGPEEIESESVDVEDDQEAPGAATIRMGGVPVDSYDQEFALDGSGEGPLPSPDAEEPRANGSEDEDMNPATDTEDDEIDEAENRVNDMSDQAAAVARAMGGEADE